MSFKDSIRSCIEGSSIFSLSFSVSYKFLLTFKDNSLIESALTHKSANKNFNNEKLEFLGDRVIGLILSKKLFDIYPNENEGILDKRFANLVKRKTCCLIGWSIGIQNHIIVGNQKKKIDINDEKILSDACEALIGAIYIDLGYDFVKKFVLKLWKNELDKSNITIFDSKTKLQEYSLKNFKKLPVYQLVNIKGPRHKPVFKVNVSIKGSKKFFGEGSSKQEAEQNSATNLINEMNIT